jgi:hypothetical protein
MQDLLSHEAFAHIVNTEGGASHKINTSEPAQGPGVMVSVPGKERITKAPLTAEQSKSFRDENAPGVRRGNEYHGAWKSGNKIFQDISRKEPSLDTARSAGESGKQIAGYDLGGTDKARPEGGEIFFDRRLPGIDSDPAWNATKESTSVAERLNPKPTKQDRKDLATTNRNATNKGKKITINEVLGTISKNRRNRGV